MAVDVNLDLRTRLRNAQSYALGVLQCFKGQRPLGFVAMIQTTISILCRKRDRYERGNSHGGEGARVLGLRHSRLRKRSVFVSVAKPCFVEGQLWLTQLKMLLDGDSLPALLQK